MPVSTIDTLRDLEHSARARIEVAAYPAELEQVRVEVLGRKGVLAQISKTLGGMAAEERAAVGRMLNTAKQSLEAAF